MTAVPATRPETRSAQSEVVERCKVTTARQAWKALSIRCSDEVRAIVDMV